MNPLGFFSWGGAGKLQATRAATLAVWACLETAAQGGGGIEPAGPVAAAPQVQFLLDEAAGKPGELVTLVLSVITSAPLQSVKVAIDFDETKLRLEDASRALDPVNPVPVDDVSKTEVDNRDESPGNQAREGWIFLELIASESTGELKWPVGQPVPVYKFLFRILDGAPEGRSPVVFGHVGPEDGTPELLNAAQAKAADVSPDAIEIPPEDLRDGFVIILGIGEIGFFLRADTNIDLALDISDPIRTLNHLFYENTQLLCEDAADANDDGRLDLSDPIYTLQWLYSGGKPIPDPQEWGPDPTEDRLCCKETGGCT